MCWLCVQGGGGKGGGRRGRTVEFGEHVGFDLHGYGLCGAADDDGDGSGHGGDGFGGLLVG